MLIKFKIKSWMAIYYLSWVRFLSQQVLDMLLDEQEVVEDSHDLLDVSLEFHFVLDYCDNTVRADSRVDLYSEGSLGVTLECGYPKMLFDPFEE
ncbi:MAG: hypothetical protein K2J46_07140, partial [Muribaculaceae bacterium]|nr:hypothetical protein [Muribaculaceae bacterium]